MRNLVVWIKWTSIWQLVPVLFVFSEFQSTWSKSRLGREKTQRFNLNLNFYVGKLLQDHAKIGKKFHIETKKKIQKEPKFQYF